MTIRVSTGIFNAAIWDGQKVIKILPHMKKADRVADAITSWQFDG